MTDKQRLRGESVGLHIDIGAGDFVDKTALPDVGITANQNSPGVGID